MVTLPPVVARVAARLKADRVVLTSAGVAFFGFLSAIPGLVALVSVYGLLADPEGIERRVDDLASTLPEEARQLIVDQLRDITEASGGALGIGLVVSLVLAMWSASSGVGHLIEALNVAYERDETRNLLRRRAVAIGFTVGALLFAVVAIAVITALPAVLAAAGITGGLRWLLTLGAWPVVGVGMMVGLAVLYRHGPDREPDVPWTWVSPGAVFAVLAWIVVSVGFQVYAGNFGSYNETYGSLGAVVLLLTWLLLSALVVVVGAVVNRELERERAGAV